MTLSTGTRLSHYEIYSQIGKGGMGEVYQAKDQKLGRDVAIKVLPEEFAKDAERVARFQREAKLLASLNHPNIAAIHGLEEADGIHFLVLELVEGDTLADRLKRGAIPVEEALKLALQIAEALEAAHEKGVIHRDLKPANIKVTPENKVKVLDFGLAKAFAGDQSDLNLSNSPTLSDAATMQGVILGTAAYMPPEQAKGKSVDKRADIWAFGVVLFEMLSGGTLFTGETVSETLASVIKSEPEWKSLPPNLHPRIRLLLERCLEKEPKDRYSGVADARVDVQKVLEDPSCVLVEPSTVAESQKGLLTILPWAAAALVIGAIIAGITGWYLKPPEPRQITSFYYELPKEQQFSDLTERAIAVSPDGRQLVYSTNGGLYLRSMDVMDAKIIPGTEENPQKPFFSPDGKWVGYISGSQLKKIAINGGTPMVLTAAADTMGFFDWETDDMIVFCQSGTGIMRVSANGGSPEVIAKAESEVLISPQILPGGNSVLFTNGTSTEYKVMVKSLQSNETTELFAGDTARYIPTGHIIYVLDNVLYAVPFDLDRLEATGGAIPLIEGIYRGLAPQYAVSDTGTLIYVPGKGASPYSQALVWVDRQGKEELLASEFNNYRYVKISPDGTRVALSILEEGNEDIHIWDLARKKMDKLTFDEASDRFPLWTADSKKIVFTSNRNEDTGIYLKPADGTGEVELLSSLSGLLAIPSSWSPDEKTLVLERRTAGSTTFDIVTLSMEGDHSIKSLLQEKSVEKSPQVSPDGRWIAYQSNETGKDEVYVRPFPNVNSGKWNVSTSGGGEPRWAPNGRELFYWTSNAIMVVGVTASPTFKAETPKLLLPRAPVYSRGGGWSGIPWDIRPDGMKFLMIKRAAVMNDESVEESDLGTPRKINIVLNWFEELKKRVPVP